MPTEIRRWHRVRTADGANATVRYIDPRDGMAEIITDDDITLTLPVAELKRVPRRVLPPIDGMPADRPTCPFCAKRLRPNVNTTHKGGSITGPIERRTFVSWNGYPIEGGNAFDKFCTLTCARAFANAAYRAGYRITRKEK
jgi:hypothetical protein